METFSIRLARLAYLRHRCLEGHPVLSTEESLLEMARSKLREHLWSHYSPEELRAARPDLEAQIRRLARLKTISQVGDEEVRESIFAFIDRVDLEEIFATVN